jgi:acyl carrier protein
MDSLMAVEISKRLQSSVGKPLPTTLAFEYGNIEALANYLATNILVLESPPPALQEPAKDEMADFMVEVEGLSEEALEDAVLKELENAGY